MQRSVECSNFLGSRGRAANILKNTKALRERNKMANQSVNVKATVESRGVQRGKEGKMVRLTLCVASVIASG